MKVIPPVELTIVNSSVDEPCAALPAAGLAAEAVWVPGANCVKGDVRIYNGRQYERQTDGAGTAPPSGDVLNWIDAGPTNKRAMFDIYRNSKTVAASPLKVTFSPGRRINALCFLGMVAEAVTVEMWSGSQRVYQTVINLNNRKTFGWYDYFFGEFSTKPSAVLFDLPPYSNAQISLTFTSSTGVVKVGGVVAGQAVYLGDIINGAENDVLNFSVIDRTPFGDATLVPRKTVPKTSQVLAVEKPRINKLRDIRNQLNAVPAVWVGIHNTENNLFESFLICGIYRKFSIADDSPLAKVSLELEEI